MGGLSSPRRYGPRVVHGGTPERTPDGRWLVIGGRRWRASDPAIPAGLRAELVKELMRGRHLVDLGYLIHLIWFGEERSGPCLIHRHVTMLAPVDE